MGWALQHRVRGDVAVVRCPALWNARPWLRPRAPILVYRNRIVTLVEADMAKKPKGGKRC
jgi:hypothetical protein